MLSQEGGLPPSFPEAATIFGIIMYRCSITNRTPAQCKSQSMNIVPSQSNTATLAKLLVAAAVDLNVGTRA
jgi:hypothetical protein